MAAEKLVVLECRNKHIWITGIKPTGFMKYNHVRYDEPFCPICGEFHAIGRLAEAQAQVSY